MTEDQTQHTQLKRGEAGKGNQLCKDLSIIKDVNRRYEGSRKLETFTTRINCKYKCVMQTED